MGGGSKLRHLTECDTSSGNPLTAVIVVVIVVVTVVIEIETELVTTTKTSNSNIAFDVACLYFDLRKSRDDFVNFEIFQFSKIFII